MAETTITISESTLERFKELKARFNNQQPDCPDHTNESFFNVLLETWGESEGDYAHESLEVIAAEEFREKYNSSDSSLTYDDVKQACKKALEEELPEVR